MSDVAAASPRVTSIPQAWLAPAAILALFAAQAVLRFASEINHDTGWYLYVAAGLLDGKSLYHDFVEVNPPLAMWLTVPAVAVSRWSGLNPHHLLYLQQFLLTAITLLLVWRYLKWAGTPHRPVLIGIVAAILLFAPGPDFGQREHLMVLLFLPWLLLRVAGTESARAGWLEAVAVGIAVAVAVCIKPHSAAAVIAVEAVLLLRHRRLLSLFAKENLTAALVIVAYGASIWIWTPEFLSDILPLGVEAYVPYYGRATDILFERSLRTFFVLALALAFLALARGIRSTLALCFIAAALGFLVSYFLQAKGYYYHLLPALSFAAMAVAVLFAASLQTLHASASPVTRVVPVFILGLVLALVWKPQAYHYAGSSFEQAIDTHRPDAASVFIASTNIFQPFPMVVKRDLQWSSRYPLQWLVPYVSYHWDGGPLPDDPIVQRALRDAVSDLEHHRPDIVFVDRRTNQDYVKAGTFDYLAFYARDPRFAAIWRNYQHQGDVAGFEIYVRSGG